jgi:AcrR family transcriptional regulator
MSSQTTSGRQRIVNEASRLFAARGYDGVSMRQVAEASDLSKAALYHHFDSKETLYLNAVQAVMARIQAALQQAASDGPWEQRLEASAMAMAQAIASRGLDLTTMIRDLARLVPSAGTWREQVGDAVLAPVVRAIRDGIEAGALARHDPVELAWMLAALVTVAGRPLVGEHDPETVHLAVAIFLDGLRIPDGQLPQGDPPDRGSG